MEQRKQTAVEFLIDNIYLLNSLKWNDIIDQAKQMEKQQIIKAYANGVVKIGRASCRERVSSPV